MHLLAATATPRDEAVAIDLAQTPGDIVILSAADSDLACLAAARRRLGTGFPSLRLANLLRLGHPISVDLYVETVLDHAKLIVVRLLGGVSYWRYGVERIVALARQRGIQIAFLPGDDKADPELVALSTLDGDVLRRHFVEGGIDNAEQVLRRLGCFIGFGSDIADPAVLPRFGVFDPRPLPSTGPTVPILFYRALVQAGDTAPVEALIAALTARGANPVALFVASLKDPEAAPFLDGIFERNPPAAIINLTGFAIGNAGGVMAETALSRADCPILQAVLSSGDAESWAAGTLGLSPRDIAMNVALPEIDGRISAGAISFKRQADRDALTEAELAQHAPEPALVDHVADLALSWAWLRACPVKERRVALILANYPTRDGRLGNGVGLDTPAATIEILRALAASGYAIADAPETSAELMTRLSLGPTNALAGRAARISALTWPIRAYQAAFARLPASIQARVTARWGSPEQDPHVIDGSFALSGYRCGNAVILIQPARGYHIDPQSSYHDPDLAPPHFYLASYLWLTQEFGIHAVVHIGKHGTLEWLPGKALALSPDCFPMAVLGAIPHLYPFIVNDPGEGSQAKRRTSAVIIDHLTPPLTRAESYGPMRDLENLVDEYYQASTLDPRRTAPLAKAIVELAEQSGIADDCGMVRGSDLATSLKRLDGFLCDLKELQIRDGLHVFGLAPKDRQLTDLLIALSRVPRGDCGGANASLLRALADDLELEFDPLAPGLAEPWTGKRPARLAGDNPWRTTGDAVERLEGLASDLVNGADASDLPRTLAVLNWINSTLRGQVEACGAAEIDGLLRGLDGRFVTPGPSGAPTRGRPDVLPTGRNFYSVDTRAVPTPAAWLLGWKSAQMLVERFAQDHGSYPKRMALSAWGTATMRTGGDDIAQCMALMGVRPVWDAASHRVTGFEIMPASLLDRPRVDVTLRVSGFFRDAFPGLIDLVDRAARAIAALDEPEAINPLAAHVRATTTELIASGLSAPAARRRASFRVFGAKPGAYGAGLQALIDESGWSGPEDLAEAFLAWGGYAYGSDADGGAAEGLEARDRLSGLLAKVEAVVHNQDNREHDLLDSDDYYQFEGGLAVTVATLKGERPAIYHNDHSRPEFPRIQRLEEELAKIVRGRAANPKWLAGVKRHGYKGAAEIAATVDYLFAFQATTGLVSAAHFDALYQAYLVDPETRDFIRDANPAALREIAQRFDEAIRRGLWQPRSNEAGLMLEELSR